jgi:hypothetical protein
VHGGAWEGASPSIAGAGHGFERWRSGDGRRPPGPAPDGQESAVATRAIVTSGVTIYERLERPTPLARTVLEPERSVEHLHRLLRPGYPSGCPGPWLRAGGQRRDAVDRCHLMASPHSLHHIGVPQYTGYSLVISLLTFLAGEAAQRR